MSNTNKSVLIIDDEEDLLKLLSMVLNKEGIHPVYTATTVKDGFSQFQLHRPDIVLLDIMLPDGEGYEVCKEIRKLSNVPILFLSAKDEEIDKLLGLAIGGDDYITKPFSPKEVAYRVKAQLRRAGFTQEVIEPSLLTAGPFILDKSQAQLRMRDNVIELKPKELGLMAHFMKNANRIISKESLCDHVWGEEFIGFDNTIMVHIRRLREKIEVNPSNPTYLVTVKGLGYKLVAKDEQQ
ncbi:response regulator transcription factor [Paenibacillus sp. L3-i20]|uniref:response regulator transcription factor n=1 Tax=Paenibacillus sp. L3-i20 TaxID=2905833 RepID=UPI001EDD8313|nr:response regulator transcription factor [Paenibacillus sp. L3-i20]GKU75619.1 DNA-binding response regulator [Paenibacillus sp. L3-i20]